ncbi:MAG: helix-turn-helix transcriptional regulator [Methanothrix sp.]|mgnify:CR=1 FL=1|jgi:putative transcriptional regulator|uniref:Transcriptional regulator, XRE family n=1 Tax=Methanothrix harundinacea TaxID=301375 RepID=A0A101IKS8_9EURY|nr:MAG: XRE family transcriptional regulator [Methanosaeta sp. SDB]KUK44366.1 MAG: Transcriptional regulator, XRE family [Methanothrix harundinacea]MDD3564544.1 helix-turn-helix transcriptional regulator [Methanothrix sp.]MDI9400250.1 helix-turn-helix transcriptional regulator [Euryarchaeota archaeon]KUK96994.1 MAG: Transcriptional regulator, XRE family [Methanothrix harundinacea]
MKNKVKVYRAVHDLTQEQLAKELGVTRQTIIAIEKDKYNPSLDLAFKMARIFGVKIEDIFVYEERPEDPPIRPLKPPIEWKSSEM